MCFPNFSVFPDFLDVQTKTVRAWLWATERISVSEKERKGVPNQFTHARELWFSWMSMRFRWDATIQVWRQLKVSAHFHTLKNKYNLTLCQSRLHTASETFICQKKFGSGSIFCVFASVACILIGKDEEYEKTEKRMRQFRTQCAMAFRLTTLTLKYILMYLASL